MLGGIVGYSKWLEGEPKDKHVEKRRISLTVTKDGSGDGLARYQKFLSYYSICQVPGRPPGPKPMLTVFIILSLGKMILDEHNFRDFQNYCHFRYNIVA